MHEHVFRLPRRAKSVIVLSVDMALVVVTFMVATMLRTSDLWPTAALAKGMPALLFALCSAGVLSGMLRTYAIKLSAFEIHALARLALWACGVTVVATVGNMILDLGAPRTVPLIAGALLMAFVVVGRLFALSLLIGLSRRVEAGEPVAVYGAGAAGLQMIGALQRSTEYRPVLLIDDDPRLHGVVMAGLRVGGMDRLACAVRSGRVSRVLVAIPSLDRAERRRLLGRIATLDVPVEALPTYPEMFRHGELVDTLRPVSPEDLLCRDSVALDMPQIEHAYTGRVVLVSGAGGSIGSELCRQLVASGVRRLVLLDASEIALYDIERELHPRAREAGVALVARLGDVCDGAGCARLMRDEAVEVVLHAAAYKHVPMVEANEVAGARNNVLGTETLATAAARSGVRRFILVSTDKAVRPTNVMGATKRLAEMAVQDLQRRVGGPGGMVLSMVRFGNVLGSSGSVIPLFHRQIAAGGPVTLTHRDVTRFFMTIPEAARLVLLAGSFADGGEVFVLDMGEPVRIMDLAHRMIELSGRSVRDERNPDGDIAIAVSGLRPGEKLYEELLIDGTTLTTPHPKILRVREGCIDAGRIAGVMAALRDGVARGDATTIRRALIDAVDEYLPSHRHDGAACKAPMPPQTTVASATRPAA